MSSRGKGHVDLLHFDLQLRIRLSDVLHLDCAHHDISIAGINNF